jgi:D-alanyl-D-alanine endopeptidase (penicillin-binding protein 7)
VSYSNHSFDWKGFKHGLALIAGVVLIGAGMHAGISYAASHFDTSTNQTGIANMTTAISTDRSSIPSLPIVISTTTPVSVINKLKIADVVPPSGKFIAADLVNMELYLYQDGTTTAKYQILTKGKPGTPYETPSGAYETENKEINYVNYAEGVKMPYSMQLYGNYFIHGWPTYLNGTPVASTYSGGCIRLSTTDAAEVYAFADKGTKVFVYDSPATSAMPTLALASIRVPSISASSFLVADVDTGDVYVERYSKEERPIASLTKLMTALVANETILFNNKITIPRGELSEIAVASDTIPETFIVGDLLYPLLMESNNNIANRLGGYYNMEAFVTWMNQEAKALNMASTTFVDPSGISRNNISTPEDLYRLAVYLANKKSFIWNITRTPQKTIDAKNGSRYSFTSFNKFSKLSSFVGGKVGETDAAGDTMVSIFALPINGVSRRIAVIILNSTDDTTDTQKLIDWFNQSATAVNTACTSCAFTSPYPKIQL